MAEKYSLGPLYVARDLNGPWVLADCDEGRAIEAELAAVLPNASHWYVSDMDEDAGTLIIFMGPPDAE